PHDDAVTFGYRPESACLERTSTSLMVRAHRRTVRIASSVLLAIGLLKENRSFAESTLEAMRTQGYLIAASVIAGTYIRSA
ncbi:MAG: hypothetical protein AB7O81_34135, partial [Blastocatellales bacterium]